MSTAQNTEIQTLQNTVECQNSIIIFLKTRAEKRELHNLKVEKILLQDLNTKSSELRTLQDANDDLRDTIKHLTRQNAALTHKLTRLTVDMPHNAKHGLDAMGRFVIQDGLSRMMTK
jgi:hypothetical protein